LLTHKTTHPTLVLHPNCVSEKADEIKNDKRNLKVDKRQKTIKINQLMDVKLTMRERRSRNGVIWRGALQEEGKKGRKMRPGFITNDMKTSTVQSFGTLKKASH